MAKTAYMYACCAKHPTLVAWFLDAALTDCKAFKSIGLKATFYSDQEMLKTFPLKSHKKVHSSSTPPVPGKDKH